MTYQKKTRPAPWLKSCPEQAAALRPESGAAGGLKARGESEAVRMAIYNPIRALFLKKMTFAYHLVRNTTFHQIIR